MRRYKIALITPPGGLTRSTWSGTLYYIGRALREHCGEVVHVAPRASLGETLGKVRDRVARKLLGHGRAYTHTPALARQWGRSLSRRIPRDVDVVVAPAGSTQIAYLKTDAPILYTSDTTFELICGYYPEFSDLPPRYVEWGNEIERRALENASYVLYPSEWAAASARRDYGVDAARVRVFPYGANLEEVPGPDNLEAVKPRERCVLTFLGVDWERKGGPIAHETVARLREMGVDAELVVVGCTPPARFAAPWMRVVPRIDKGDPNGRVELSRLLARSTFLLLPTRRECFGIVFCEASAHGTPSVATDTGGVAGAVTPGENGFLLPPSAGGREYAGLIHELFRDTERTRTLVQTTRRAFDERLNWGAWASRARELMEEVA